MNNTRGFLYVCFGQNYVMPLQTSLKYVKRVSKHPVCVVTNQRDLNTENIDELVYVDMPDNANRAIRTRAIDYTPFDQTLMTDADSIPISRRVNELFNGLDNHDFGFQWVKQYVDKVPRIYGHAMYKTDVTPPLDVYSGGIILFNKSEQCGKLFDRWNEYWKLTGCGRDMPALNCAIRKSTDVRFYLVDRCIDREIDSDTIIFHAYGEHDRSIMPKFEKNKPFDNRNDFFTMISVTPNGKIESDPLNET